MHSDKNIPAICESIMLFDALHKHKVCIDAILEGLEMFKLKTAIKVFPEYFKCLFLKKSCTPTDIINCLRFGGCGSYDKEQRLEYLIKRTIENMSNSGTVVSSW